MGIWASVLIVAAWGGAPIDARYPGATTAFECDFEEDSDLDFDGWPHGWHRHRGPGYPHYLKIGISRDDSYRGTQCFRFDLDGGAAAATSSPIEYHPGSEYLADVAVKTEGLRHDEATVALRFLDAEGRPVRTEYGPRLRTTEWRQVRIGPVACDHPEARSIIVELRLEPGESGRDLHGSAMFDDVWIGRLPRKSVRGSRPYNVFQALEPIELSVALTGVAADEIRATLELFDRHGKKLSAEERSSAQIIDGDPDVTPRTITWNPPLREPGFYRGRVTVYGPHGVLREDETSLVIVRPMARLQNGPGSFVGDFGWSISESTDVVRPDELHVVLHEAAVRRVKYPVWYAVTDSPEARQTKRVVERLNLQGIAVVGMLTPLPPGGDGRETPRETAAAQTFRDAPARWLPLVEPTMFDLAFKVRGWQLGNDHDLGFLALPGAVDRIAAVKKEFDRIEQDSQVGVPWSWMQELPPTDARALRFLALTSSPELAAHEIGPMLDGAALPTGIEAWVGMSALPTDDYTTDDRVCDLVDRMLAAKAHNAGGVFFIDPFAARTGLFERNGSPTELFLPWRAVAATLDGARYGGSITLPEGSRNRLFYRSGDAVLVVSRDVPGHETLAMAGNPVVTGLWENDIPTTTTAEGIRFEVGATPVIITGLHRESAAWEGALKVDKQRLNEVFGVSQPLTITLRNTFGRPVQGKVSLNVPAHWTLRPDSFDISLGMNEEVRLPFEVLLPPGGETRDAMLRIDHDIAADERHRFSVYRELQVGDGEVTLEVDTRFVGDTLEIEQRIINNSPTSVSFRCNLFAPDQRRMRTLVNDLPPGLDVQVYRLPNARSLEGRTLWIRADELNGARVLSERFVVGENE